MVIPSYNEASNIGRCLKAIAGAAQALPEHEVLVIDNGSTDRTREIATEMGARVIRPDRRVSIAELRNMGGRDSREHCKGSNAQRVPLSRNRSRA